MAYLTKLNNEAVALFGDRRCPLALEKFHEALCQMREIMNASSQHDPPRCHEGGSQEAGRTHAVLPYQNQEGTAEDMFLYFNGIVLKETLEQHPSTFAICCAATLFNCAVIYHMEGVATQKMSFMDKALHMYQASLHFLQGVDLQNDTCLLVALAATNNMAQIELEKGMVDGANRRLYHTYALLQHSKTRALDMFAGSEIHGFLLNSSLQGKITSAAAA